MRKLDEMTYTELERHLTEVVIALRTKAYASGYAQGKFDKLADEELTPTKTPQELRDEIVERAKTDISELKKEYGHYRVNYAQFVPKEKRTSSEGQFASCNVKFIVKREKRTVVALMLGDRTNDLYARGIAKCAPDDCFNVHIGKAIALRRALGLEVPAEYLNVPQPTEVQVGDIVKSTEFDYVRTVERFCDDEITDRRHGRPFRTKETFAWLGVDQVDIIDDSREFSE